MEKEENEEPIICFNLYGGMGAPINFIGCSHCGFRNIINCPHPGPKKRLSSIRRMECGKRLTCPDCGNGLREGLISERDAILLCSNCGFWVHIW